MTTAAIVRLIDLIMADRPDADETETTRLIKEATPGMPSARAADLTAEFNRSFGLLGMSVIADPHSPHADDFRKECLSILRDISGSEH